MAAILADSNSLSMVISPTWISVGRFHPRGRRARVPSRLTPRRRALGPAIRSAWPPRHSLPGRRHPTVRHATNAPPPPSCVGPNSASILHRRPRGRLRQLSGSAPAPPRASALHQSSFRNLRLQFNYRSQMSQLTVTHPTNCDASQPSISFNISCTPAAVRRSNGPSKSSTSPNVGACSDNQQGDYGKCVLTRI